MYKVEIGGLVVHVETMAQLRELVETFSRTNGTKPTAAEFSAAVEEDNSAPPPGEPSAPKVTPKGAIYAPTEVKIRSTSTQDALYKFYKGLDNLMQQETFQFLASKGEEGASVEEMKEALKLPEKYKFSGLTAAVRRRAPHYGVTPEQILLVEYRGVVANVRILDYRLGTEMLEMMKAHGFLWRPKEEKKK